MHGKKKRLEVYIKLVNYVIYACILTRVGGQKLQLKLRSK